MVLENRFWRFFFHVATVLILIFLEDGLGVLKSILSDLDLYIVLILIFLEDGLGVVMVLVRVIAL